MGVMKKKTLNGETVYIARVRIGGINRYGVTRKTETEAIEDSNKMLETGALPEKVKREKLSKRSDVISIERARSFVRAFIDVVEFESDPSIIKDYCHQLIRELSEELKIHK